MSSWDLVKPKNKNMLRTHPRLRNGRKLIVTLQCSQKHGFDDHKNVNLELRVIPTRQGISPVCNKLLDEYSVYKLLVLNQDFQFSCPSCFYIYIYINFLQNPSGTLCKWTSRSILSYSFVQIIFNPFSASCILKFSQPEPILFIEQI